MRAARSIPLLGLALFGPLGALPAQQSLLEFPPGFDVGSLEARDVHLELVPAGGGRALLIASGHRAPWPGITLRAPAGRWDLSKRERIELEVHNLGDEELRVCCRVDNPGADGVKHCISAELRLRGGARATLSVALRSYTVPPPSGALFGMRGYPRARARLDLANIVQLIVFVPRPERDHRFTIEGIRAAGETAPAEPLSLPLIDTFGQYCLAEWPGKTHSESDLHRAVEEEDRDLARHPGPAGWNRWGGWERGPQLEATGFFRTAKVDGRWWLVDPSGRLFWSHGIDCVRPGHATTPISDRRSWFADLPAKGAPPAAFYGRSSWAPHGYYQGRAYETFDFSSANLLRKLGPRWRELHAARAHRRLRSWGMNTIGNWSSETIYLQRKTPYTVAIHVASPPLRGSKGYWGKFPDVFAPAFERALHAGLARERTRSAADPWCLGYFIANELSWGSDLSLAQATLASPPDQPAKKAFLADLRARYREIAALNRAWKSSYPSWDALLAATAPPDPRRARADLLAFATRTAERYFRSCRRAVADLAPHHLYLGCRFSAVNDLAARAAARYCDVLSYNRYQRTLAAFRPPRGIDKPVLIGEFHFGARDRGLFHPGLVPVRDQADRARAYRRYLQSALENPCIVGTHWFQYGDQATTGRGDGENYQIGFLDVADRPYPETIAASRAVGSNLYASRLAR